ARHGERGMYLTFEESSSQIKKYGSRFFPDLPEHIDNGLIQILDFSPHIQVTDENTHDVGGEKVTVPPRDHMDSIAYIEDKILDIRGQTIQRVVLDGLQTFATTFYDLSGKHDSDELRRTLSRILVLLKREKITTYLLSEVLDEKTDKYSFINFTVDGIFHLKVNEALDVRTLKISKMRGIRHTLKPLTIKLTEGQGILMSDRQKHKL
ncbi:MAG: hypothetical protein GF334_00630, partial [Candidatus Altiarchaeales archaeon]|nr:hypothetical protein [Candidatus Altiarchaeales archaeon]